MWVFVAAVYAERALKNLWFAMNAAGREHLEQEFQCCGYDSISADPRCEFNNNCRIAMGDYVGRRLNIVGVLVMIVAVVQIFSLVLAKLLARVPEKAAENEKGRGMPEGRAIPEVRIDAPQK